MLRNRPRPSSKPDKMLALLDQDWFRVRCCPAISSPYANPDVCKGCESESDGQRAAKLSVCKGLLEYCTRVDG